MYQADHSNRYNGEKRADSQNSEHYVIDIHADGGWTEVTAANSKTHKPESKKQTKWDKHRRLDAAYNRQYKDDTQQFEYI